ncbi:MAG: ABC transporter ATP-binding protein [Pseudanabaenaceae cyanobacterium bins.68]|nr:ABC transporter ATP-binding protein [Pseudanabaenaceae cyanobacterium bins.68]
MANLLQVDQLNVRFRQADGKMAVRSLGFSLAAGEVLGIVGESGSGKSITALSLIGLLPDQAIATGEIWLTLPEQAPVNLLTLSPAQIRPYRGRQIAMIFQEPMTALNPLFSCGSQILEAINLHHNLAPRAATDLAIQLLAEVKLPHPAQILHRYPHQLSGGQLQRLMIAIALCGNPRLLIADEPTTALDVTIQAEILQLIQQLQRDRQMAVILISHDLGVIGQVADRIAVMRQGEILEIQPTAALFQQPQHPYTKGLIACRPRPDQNYKYLPTVSDFDQEGQLTSDRFAIQVSELEQQQRLEQLQQQPPLLRVENLQVKYSHHLAVNQVSFGVHRGETLGLVGESGCGKSTLARAVLGLMPIASGQIWFEDTPIGLHLASLRRHLQVIFQDPYSSLNPRMTVGEAIAEPLEIHRIYQGKTAKQQRQQRVQYLLERVGLEPTASRFYPHQFSGGQRQRICIARALSLNPKLIIADEPVSALDVSVQAQVLNLLKELQAEFDLTYIFISHDLSVVKFMSDRIMVMYQGEIIETGSASQIYRHPAQPYTQKLLSAVL